MGQKTTAQALREQLMAPSAIDRVHALHALELALENAPTCPVAKELAAFTARGIPYYAPEDAHYCEWVAQAVRYLERLQAEEARALARPAAATAARSAANKTHESTRETGRPNRREVAVAKAAHLA